jgi:hypothetical protein
MRAGEINPDVDVGVGVRKMTGSSEGQFLFFPHARSGKDGERNENTET